METWLKFITTATKPKFFLGDYEIVFMVRYQVKIICWIRDFIIIPLVGQHIKNPVKRQMSVQHL